VNDRFVLRNGGAGSETVRLDLRPAAVQADVDPQVQQVRCERSKPFAPSN
jgi:hypothetical protein